MACAYGLLDVYGFDLGGTRRARISSLRFLTVSNVILARVARLVCRLRVIPPARVTALIYSGRMVHVVRATVV